MKISCLPCSIFEEIVQNKMTLADWVYAAESIGYDGFDISMIMLKNHTQTYLSEVKALFQAVNIPPVMATTYPDFTHPDIMQRRREKSYMMRDISICQELGIPYLRVLAGQEHPGVEHMQGVQWAIEGLRDAAAYAKGSGVRLLFENHYKPSAWDRVDFSFPLDIFHEVWEGISDTDIRLNFDIGNLVAQNCDPLAEVEKLADKIETVHISDMACWGKFKPVIIGTGVSPIPEVVKKLQKCGFNGWLCIEEGSGNGLKGIHTAWEYVSGILHPNQV